MNLKSWFKLKRPPFSNESLNKLYYSLFCDNLNRYKLDLKFQKRANLETILNFPSEKLNASSFQQECELKNLDTRSVFYAHSWYNFKFSPKKPIILGVIIQTKFNDFIEVNAFFHDGSYILLDSSEQCTEATISNENCHKHLSKLFTLCENTIIDKPQWKGVSAIIPQNNEVLVTILSSKGKFGCSGSHEAYLLDDFGKNLLINMNFIKSNLVP